MGGGKGAKKAARAQIEGINKSIAAQNEQFNYIKDLISPYEQGGNQAFMAQLDLLGLGTGSQEDAINNLTSQPYFTGLVNQGEQALLQNASATGGLRGGNIQAALAQFRPNMIQQLVQQQLSNLGGITGTGMQGVGVLSNASQNFANNMSQAQMGIGQANATRAMQPSGFQQALNTGLQIAGVAGGLGWAPFSDIRLKSNIQRIGTHIKGFGIYSYNIFGRHEYGVIAQEVLKIVPSAIKMHPSGYLTVNYGAL